MLSNLTNRPETYPKLLEAGFPAEGIPDWVMRPPIADDQKDAITDQKDAITDQNDRKNDIGDIDDSKLSRAAKSSVTIGQRIDDRSISSISPAIVDSADKRLGEMIDKANANLQHPSGLIQIDGRWAAPIVTPEGLPTGAYRWGSRRGTPPDDGPRHRKERLRGDAAGGHHADPRHHD